MGRDQESGIHWTHSWYESKIGFEKGNGRWTKVGDRSPGGEKHGTDGSSNELARQRTAMLASLDGGPPMMNQRGNRESFSLYEAQLKAIDNEIGFSMDLAGHCDHRNTFTAARGH